MHMFGEITLPRRLKNELGAMRQQEWRRGDEKAVLQEPDQG